MPPESGHICSAKYACSATPGALQSWKRIKAAGMHIPYAIRKLTCKLMVCYNQFKNR